MSDNPNITISAHSSGLHVALCGNLDQFSIPAILSKIAPLADKKISGTMFVDLQAVDKMDDYGALVVMKLNGIASELKIPIIGIGAGNGVDGQVLVSHDMMGITHEFSPRFLRRYLNLYDEMKEAVEMYVKDVKSSDFPNDKEQY